MRRLFILAVVLAFASAADATVLSWSADSITMTLGGTAVVQLVADDAAAFNAKWVGNDPSSVATIASIVALPAAGSDAVVQDPAQTGYPGWWTVETADFFGGSASGAQYDVTIQAGSVTGAHSLDSDDLGTNDILEITVVPEPSSVLLLSLGALAFLRKRKR